MISTVDPTITKFIPNIMSQPTSILKASFNLELSYLKNVLLVTIPACIIIGLDTYFIRRKPKLKTYKTMALSFIHFSIFSTLLYIVLRRNSLLLHK